MNLVEKEIAQLAAKVREEHLASVGPLGRKAYESDAVPEYSEAMKHKFRNKVREEYIQKLSMSESVIKPLVQVYAEVF